MTSPFDYLNAINSTKVPLIVDDITEKQYLPFVINRSLSYFQDSVMFANEMNLASHLDNKLQEAFLISIIRKRKRFSKWLKPHKETDLEVIKEYYGYSNEKARTALSLLSDENIIELKKKVNKGGRK